MSFLRKLHKWLGLIAGLQLVLWAVSGLVFAWLDHHEVTAEHAVRAAAQPAIPADLTIAEPAAWLDDASVVSEIRLMPLEDQWVWRIAGPRGTELRDARTGEPFSLDPDFVSALARSRYAGAGRLVEVRLHAKPILEARGAGSVWEARFDDDAGTALYFAAEDGRLVAARNEAWRLFDFFWMLHTMDYRGRDDFNNPVVIAFGTAALWLSLSGLLLLLRSFRRQDFGLPRR